MICTTIFFFSTLISLRELCTAQVCARHGIIFDMSSSRSLLSLGLQNEVLAALTRNGYENLRDLISVTAEGLAKGKTSSLRINRRDFIVRNS